MPTFLFWNIWFAMNNTCSYMHMGLFVANHFCLIKLVKPVLVPPNGALLLALNFVGAYWEIFFPNHIN